MIIYSVQQSASVYHKEKSVCVCVCVCVCIHTHILFHILFYYGLSQDIVYSSLCYTVRPCCLSILYKVVCLSLLLGSTQYGANPHFLEFSPTSPDFSSYKYTSYKPFQTPSAETPQSSLWCVLSLITMSPSIQRSTTDCSWWSLVGGHGHS